MNGDDNYEKAMEPLNSFNWEPPLFVRDNNMDCREMSDDDLAILLRKAANAWFNNSQLLVLEELIRRAKLSRLRLEDGVK